MRTIPARLALLVVLALAPSVLVVHGQQNPEAMPRAGLVRLLDADQVAFGVRVDARADPVALSANDDIDFVFFDMEHGPYDVSALRTWMAGKAVIVRIPATGRELDQNIWMVKQVLDVGAHGIIFPTVETPAQALTAIRAMRYPQRLGAPDREPAGLRGTNPRLAARYWGLSVPDYIERADVWRLDPRNGNLLPWLLIESPLGVANVREIARQLSERNIGAVLFAGSETGGDMLNTHGGSLEAVAQAIDIVLAAGKEFGLPVAMTSTTNMLARIEQGARLFTGGVTPALRREAGR
jgi:4-hydroxy-2-oxoheptanedioate aldolase